MIGRFFCVGNLFQRLKLWKRFNPIPETVIEWWTPEESYVVSRVIIQEAMRLRPESYNFIRHLFSNNMSSHPGCYPAAPDIYIHHPQLDWRSKDWVFITTLTRVESSIFADDFDHSTSSALEFMGMGVPPVSPAVMNGLSLSGYWASALNNFPVSKGALIPRAKAMG